MSVIDWSQQLEHILNCPIYLSTKSSDEIIEFNNQSTIPLDSSSLLQIGQIIESEHLIWLLAEQLGEQFQVIELTRSAVTENEKALLRLLILQSKANQSKSIYEGMSNHEKQVTKLGEWLVEQLEEKHGNTSIPDRLLIGSQLYNEMVPILLVADSASHQQTSFQELDRLLRSFLSEDILLIPLQHEEWLIWGPLALLKDDDPVEGDSEVEETLEDSLENIALGLHEMLANEWIGDCHLAITFPVVPMKLLVETTMSLRETIHIGRKFHQGTNIHLQWMLQLERLLHAIPENERQKYLEQSLKRAELFVESEMLATLDTFFDLDCNVSETAKKLYIHRNTLLYRLDKLKQETGLDVRLFRDAVLVKIILLLYKVTKTH